jgi:diguanylate cyclase (GGDEF)-like protein/PAS domain S-box-containing protein
MNDQSKTKHDLIQELVFLRKRVAELSQYESEHKQVEESLRESEYKYRSLIENMTDIIFITIDLEGKITFVSKRTKEILGYENEETIDRNILNFIPEEAHQSTMERLQKGMEGEKIKHVQLPVIAKSGNKLFFDFSFSRIYKDGVVVGAQGTAVDITERKQIEDMLRQSELNYRQLFDNAPAAIYQVDFRTGKFLKANDLICEYFGCSQEEITSKSPCDLLTKESQILFLERLNQMVIGDKVPEDPEYEFVDKNGKRRWLKLNSKNIYDSTGLAGADVVAHEITERKLAEEALRKNEQRYLELSIIDDLTQLYNSRHFYAQLKREIERSNRYEQPLTLLLLDLDNFKTFNDTYGHVEGDYVLSRLGQVVKRCLRETDSAYRYGGEEFTIMLPMTTSEEGMVTAKRIQMELRKEAFSPVLGQEVYLTVSIGLAQYKPKEEMKAFVNRVDQLMYQAKKNGRDRICPEPQR